ncbi:MAG TPA: hypothetical protein VG488_09755 [Candidatus Angelobacter sp.]|jgi:hypothetical protein|nr:hypothetical protein [Candidatus Angelobacter sp.]
MTDPVLNELSFQASAINRVVAREWMASLIDSLREATSLGLKRTLRCSVEFYDHMLTRDYLVSSWRNDHEVDKDTQTFFRRLTTNYPAQAGLEQFLLDTEYKCAGQNCLGFATATLLETIAFSIPSSSQWAVAFIEIERVSLDENMEVSSHQIAVRHASSKTHVQSHSDWIEQCKEASIKNGADLYQRRAELLPSLLFSQEAARQLENLTDQHVMLRPTIARLLEFQRLASSWTAGAFNSHSLSFKVTPESARTLQQYAGTRTFRFDHGPEECSWHARMTPGAWRLHFSWNNAHKTILIGYVGHKLPTVLTPT